MVGEHPATFYFEMFTRGPGSCSQEVQSMVSHCASVTRLAFSVQGKYCAMFRPMLQNIFILINYVGRYDHLV